MPDGSPESTAARGAEQRLLLCDVTLADGRNADVLISDGVIASVTASGPGGRAVHTTDITAADGAEVVPLSGYVLLPSPVEPHAHLDKALLADRFPNPTFDLPGAITAIRRAYASMSAEDIEERASRATAMAMARGVTAVRTHADCGADIGPRAVEGLLALRDALRGLLHIQVVALAGFPLSGREGAANRQALRIAVEAGADLVGGAPALDTDPRSAVRVLVQAAQEAGCGMDLHIDETTDAAASSLRELAEVVIATGFEHPVTASHCVSLGVQPLEQVRDTAKRVADAGISVVTLPQTNLYLQGRDASTSVPRGLTAIRELRDCGVTVAGGGDNWRDPFNPMGRTDPLETAGLLVVAGHLSPIDAYDAVSAAARKVLGLPVVRVEPGYPADLLAVRGRSLADALADAGDDRLVLKAGRRIVRTRVAVEWDDVAGDRLTLVRNSRATAGPADQLDQAAPRGADERVR